MAGSRDRSITLYLFEHDHSLAAAFSKSRTILLAESLKKEATIIKPGGNKSMNDLSLAFKTEERVFFFSPCRISGWLELIAIT